MQKLNMYSEDHRKGIRKHFKMNKLKKITKIHTKTYAVV